MFSFLVVLDFESANVRAIVPGLNATASQTQHRAQLEKVAARFLLCLFHPTLHFSSFGSDHGQRRCCFPERERIGNAEGSNAGDSGNGNQQEGKALYNDFSFRDAYRLGFTEQAPVNHK